MQVHPETTTRLHSCADRESRSSSNLRQKWELFGWRKPLISTQKIIIY
jgi:hypothetical protein